MFFHTLDGKIGGPFIDDEEEGGEGTSQQEKSLDELSEEAQMQQLMGFGSFDTTKGKKIDDNHRTASKGFSGKVKQRKYTQYMNKKIIRNGERGGRDGGPLPTTAVFLSSWTRAR